jgi:hypothetical protein
MPRLIGWSILTCLAIAFGVSMLGTITYRLGNAEISLWSGGIEIDWRSTQYTFRDGPDRAGYAAPPAGFRGYVLRRRLKDVQWAPDLDASDRRLFVPLWMPFAAVAAGMLAGVVVGRFRTPLGFCRCGYDLRASPGQCPECGRASPCQSAAPR